VDAQRFRTLSAKQRAVVAVAVLLDGREAENYLANDITYGPALSRAAHALADQPPELRMPFLGSMLRAALREIASGRG